MAQGSIGKGFRILLIGGSAGSLEVMMQLLPLLRPDLSLAVIIILHRKNGESLLTDLLGDRTTWPVMEAEEKETVKPQTVYVAPADYHLLIEQDGSLSLDDSEKVHFSRPAIDVTFETAAEVWGEAVIGVLLSGANADGAQGLKTIADAGGTTIVQDPEEAAVSYMPQKSIELFQPHYIEEAKGIAEIINQIVGGK